MSLPTQEAARICGGLVETYPEVLLPHLASSFHNLANRLGELGRPEEAVPNASTAVTLYSRLACDNPNAFLPELAMSLSGLGNRFLQAGDLIASVGASRAALHLYRELADFRSVGAILASSGPFEEALEVSEEAVSVARSLSERNPTRFLPDLARSLHNLGDLLGEAGRWEEAWSVSEAAVRALAPLFQRSPAVYSSLMIPILTVHAKHLAKLGREPDLEILQPILECIRGLPVHRERT